VLGSDGREQIEYDLLITNAFTADATLYSLEVRGGGRGCLSMTGAALHAVTLQLTSSKPTDGRIGHASTVVTQVDIALPRWARRTVPALLTNQIRTGSRPKALSRPVIGITTIETPAPRSIGVRRLCSLRPYAEPDRSTATGAAMTPLRNLELRTPQDFGGNRVILQIGTGRYACCAHLIHGSVRLRRGEHVRAGQRIGLLGKSGNTDAPHLHFGIQRRPDGLAKSDPFEIGRYTLEGIVRPSPAPPAIDVIGSPRNQIRSHPLSRSVSTFFGPATPR
jgi:hypothetical protein